jgi:AraC-like DNA-binding protein
MYQNFWNYYEKVENRMPFNFLNIPYSLAASENISLPRLHSIWKVEADDRYQEFKPAGLGKPGIFLTWEGQGLLKYTRQGNNSKQTITIPSNTFLFMDSSVPCEYRCPPGGCWKFYFIHLSELEPAFEQLMPLHKVCDTLKMNSIVQLCEQIIEAMIKSGPGYSFEASHWMNGILLSLLQERRETESFEYADIAEIRYWIHRHLSDPLTIETILRQYGSSRTLFFQRFKAATGQTPNIYLLKLRLEAAKTALLTTNRNIKSIAASLHFYDEYHFSKLFKKEYGLPPSAFRKL